MNDKSIETASDETGEFVIYSTEDGRTEVHLRLLDGSVWMTQAQIAELFGVSRANVSAHIKNIYEDNELSRDRTIKSYLIVQSEGDRDIKREVDHYNLEAIMAVGYRVRGPRGIQFRRWATEVLSEYLIKGFALNDEKLKDPRGMDYFDELLDRIRDIRSSEARFYKKVLDLFALSVDYDKKEAANKKYFQKIQNKLHYAITGQTASEILATRCDPSAQNLGLVTFKGNKVHKGDIVTAKNYLTKEELEELNLLVSQFLDYAENQTRRRKVIHMQDWIEKTDAFIEFNEYEPLNDTGRISMTQAKNLVGERYALYDSRRRQAGNAEFDTQIIDEMQKVEQQILAARARLSPRKQQ
ncbi:RhuM family protein [Corynebacteriaceae bacterium 6-324]